VGAVFEVTPQIDDNLTTTIAISPSITDLRGEKESPDGQSNALRVGVRRFRSTVILQNGETALLGGYIEAQDGTTQRSVPGLGSIPVIGRAFRTDARIRTRSEYIILVSVEAKNAERSAPMQVAEPSADQSAESMALIRQSKITGQLTESMHKALNEPMGVTKPAKTRMVESAPNTNSNSDSTSPASSQSQDAPRSDTPQAQPQPPAVELLGGS
jgi:Flp pilus assembly secretin CpaC